MRPESCFRMAANWPEIEKITMTSQFANKRHCQLFFDVAVFLLSSLGNWFWSYDNFRL